MVISDFTNTTSSSFSIGGTIRWMSPELFYVDPSGVKDTRPMKQSDCYALGMVIYEVLSGQVPFAPFHCYNVILMVTLGERPKRPNGPEGAWFTNDLWRMLNRCWETQPQCRPGVGIVLGCLERVSGDSEILSRHADDDVGTDENGLGAVSGSPRRLFWSNSRYFFAFLCSILWVS